MGLSLVVAGFSAVLVASPPGGPSQAVPGVPGWLDDQRAEQRGDLVAGKRDLIVWWRMGVFGGGGEGEECQGEHGQGGPPVPGGPAADLMLVQAGEALAGLEVFLNPPPLMPLKLQSSPARRPDLGRY